MTPKIEDVVYLSPEELRRRGLAPPPDESRPNNDAPEPDEEPHGEYTSENIMEAFVRELKRVGYFDRKAKEFLNSLRGPKP